MTNSIRSDIHARFLALVARADAKVRSEEQPVQKRSSSVRARDARQRARVVANPDEGAA